MLESNIDLSIKGKAGLRLDYLHHITTVRVAHGISNGVLLTHAAGKVRDESWDKQEKHTLMSLAYRLVFHPACSEHKLEMVNSIKGWMNYSIRNWYTIETSYREIPYLLSIRVEHKFLFTASHRCVAYKCFWKYNSICTIQKNRAYKLWVFFLNKYFSCSWHTGLWNCMNYYCVYLYVCVRDRKKKEQGDKNRGNSNYRGKPIKMIDWILFNEVKLD